MTDRSLSFLTTPIEAIHPAAISAPAYVEGLFFGRRVGGGLVNSSFAIAERAGLFAIFPQDYRMSASIAFMEPIPRRRFSRNSGLGLRKRRGQLEATTRAKFATPAHTVRG